MTDQQVSDRGVEASRILESQAYKDAMSMMRESIVAKWKTVSLRDQEGQKLTLQMMKLADTFESLLSGMVEAGKFANHKLDVDRLRDESVARRIVRRVL
jgi:ribosomal protein L22